METFLIMRNSVPKNVQKNTDIQAFFIKGLAAETSLTSTDCKA